MGDHTKLRAFELADEVAMLVYRVTAGFPSAFSLQPKHLSRRRGTTNSAYWHIKLQSSLNLQPSSWRYKAMVHYTCDMCGKVLVSGEDTRYKVKIETYIADDLDDMEDGFDDDDGELMEDMDNTPGFDEEDKIDSELEEMEYRAFQYDLCSICYKRYIQDPLSNKFTPNRRFFEN